MLKNSQQFSLRASNLDTKFGNSETGDYTHRQRISHSIFPNKNYTSDIVECVWVCYSILFHHRTFSWQKQQSSGYRTGKSLPQKSCSSALKKTSLQHSLDWTSNRWDSSVRKTTMKLKNEYDKGKRTQGNVHYTNGQIFHSKTKHTQKRLAKTLNFSKIIKYPHCSHWTKQRRHYSNSKHWNRSTQRPSKYRVPDITITVARWTDCPSWMKLLPDNILTRLVLKRTTKCFYRNT